MPAPTTPPAAPGPSSGVVSDSSSDPWSGLSAHGLGGQQDLPIPLGLAVAGAVAALMVSVVVLALAWRTPRYDATVGGRDAPRWVWGLVEHPASLIVMRAVGMVFFLYAVVVAVFGVDKLINPFFGIVYVWLWVGIVPMSLLLGPFWKMVSPVRTLARAFEIVTGSPPGEGLRAYPTWLGCWPAAFGLLAFVWLELVYAGGTELAPVRLWFAVYVAVVMLGGVVFGEEFFERADPFEVYSTLVGRLSVWRLREGRLIVASPLSNLGATPVVPGLIGVVGVLFGSTGYDSFRGSPGWVGFVQGSAISGTILNNAALAVFCIGAAAIIAVGSMLTGIGPGRRRRDLPDAFAHAIVPIIVGYVVAHYLNYFLEVGTRTLVLASDPFSTGADYLGTGDWRAVSWLAYHPTLLASIKVLAVIVGHVVGAAMAHDRALRLLPERHRLTGQLPLVVAMVGFTAGGLFLLFSA